MKLSVISALFICACGFVRAASWFDGSVGGTAVHGSWSAPLAEGVSLSGGKYVLTCAEAPLAFSSETTKIPNAYTNVVFTMTVNFPASAETLPEIPDGTMTGFAVAGVSPKYYVLSVDPVSDPATNRWTDTGVSATIGEDVEVIVTVTTNGCGGTFVGYRFGASGCGPYAVVANGAWGQVAYAGDGSVSVLSGEIQENWVPPPGKTIPESARASVEAWAKENGVRVDEFADTTTDSQGRTKYESCLLGLDIDRPFKAYSSLTGAVDKLGIDVTEPLDGVGEKVKYRLYDGNDKTIQFNTASSFKIPLGEGRQTYRVQPYVDDVPVGSPTDAIGVQTVAGAAETLLLPVPWTETGSASDISVTNLIKTSCLGKGDQIDVYDAAEGAWITCQYDGTKWSVANGATVPAAERGSAFRLTRAVERKNTPVYLIGGASVAIPTSKTIVRDTFNLLAKPDGTAFSLERLQDGDRVLMMEEKTGLPTESYTKFHGKWVKKVTGGAATEATAIEANRGFFLKSSASEVDW